MKKTYLFRSILILTLLILSYFLMPSNSSISTQVEPICKESMDEPSNKSLPSGEMIWENISRQFIFTSKEFFR